MTTSYSSARSQLIAQIVDGADSSITPSKLRQVLIDAFDALNDVVSVRTDLTYLWSTNTAASDPGNTYIKGNNATFASITALYMSETSLYKSVGGYQTSVFGSSSTVKAYVLIVTSDDQANYILFRVDSHTDSGAYRTLSGAVVASGGNITSDDSVLVSIQRVGDPGGVASFNGRTGVVTATNDDYAVTQLSAIAAHSIVGNNTGSSARPIVLTTAQLKTLIAIVVADITDASANGRSLISAADYAAMRTLLSLGTAALLAETTTAQYLSNTADKALSTDQVWAAGALVSLTDGATITPDFSTGINFSVTLGGNRTLANPSNPKVGQSGFIRIAQDGTGSRTLAYGANWKFVNGVAPTLSTTASKVDILAYVVTGASEVVGNLIPGVV